MESTQYIILSGHEKADDIERVMGKIKLPNPVTISYRNASCAVSNLFIDPLVAALKGSGVKDVATLFADPFQVDQLRRAGLGHGIAVRES